MKTQSSEQLCYFRDTWLKIAHPNLQLIFLICLNFFIRTILFKNNFILSLLERLIWNRKITFSSLWCTSILSNFSHIVFTQTCTAGDFQFEWLNTTAGGRLCPYLQNSLFSFKILFCLFWKFLTMARGPQK